METEASHSRDEIRKELEPYFEALVDRVCEMIAGASGAVDEVDFEGFEDMLDEEGDELKRQACKMGLEACEVDQERVEIDGKEHYQCMTSRTTYRSRWGGMPVERNLFREKGEHNGETVAPLELRAGIVEGTWTPGTARMIGEYVQELPAKRGAELSPLEYSATSFKRLGSQLGQGWEESRAKIEPVELEIPEETTAISVLVDRVGVLMRESDELNWRMMWCGAVCLHNGDGDILQTLRYGAIPEKLDEALRRPMRKDVDRILECRPDLDRIALGDGGTDVCQFLDEEFPDWERRLDFMHVIEKIADALHGWCEEHETTRAPNEVLRAWKLDLLNDETAIEAIEESIQRWAGTENSTQTDEAIDAALTYIDNHRDEMRYASIRERGLPVGSGAVEATCKNLVALRMKRNGQSWSYPGAQAILNLRSLALSDRWDEGMDRLLSTYRQSVQPMPAQAA